MRVIDFCESPEEAAKTFYSIRMWCKSTDINVHFLGPLIFFCIWERTLAGINLQNWLAWRVVMSAWTKASSASCIGVIYRSDYHWFLLNFAEIQVIKPHFFLLLYFCLPVLPMDTGGKRPAVEATAVVLLYVQSLNSGSESELCV